MVSGVGFNSHYLLACRTNDNSSICGTSQTRRALELLCALSAWVSLPRLLQTLPDFSVVISLQHVDSEATQEQQHTDSCVNNDVGYRISASICLDTFVYILTFSRQSQMICSQESIEREEVLRHPRTWVPMRRTMTFEVHTYLTFCPRRETSSASTSNDLIKSKTPTTLMRYQPQSSYYLLSSPESHRMMSRRQGNGLSDIVRQKCQLRVRDCC